MSGIPNGSRVPEVLLVEDDPAHAHLFQEAAREAGVSVRIARAASAEEAWARLADPKREPPRVVFLDLNLPGKGGRELLVELKQHPKLRQVPVVVLSCSNDPDDVKACYRAYANAYVVKPCGWEDLVRLVRSSLEFWVAEALPWTGHGARAGCGGWRPM
ncbi:response regulator [Deferrisoma camini]|uniref:response regulator n=1 Tax=Deferrisoma camini TaxID=1035120 RepID=UPI00046CF6C0|nr:response regulator [Deferrisoma camini]